MGYASGFIASAPMAVAKLTRPLSVALQPKPTCIRPSTRNGLAPAPKTVPLTAAAW